MRTPHPAGGALFFRRAQPEEIAGLHALTVREIGPKVASLAVMQRVHRHNADSLWAILRAETDKSAPQLAGFYGFLHLNAEGRAALEARALNAQDPALAHLAAFGERPAAIYVWAVVARKMRALIAPLIPQALPKKIYGGLPILATAGTEGGLMRLAQIAADAGNENANAVGDLFRVDIKRTSIPQDESEPENARKAKTSRAPAQRLEARVAATSDDMQRVFALRAAVFMSEQLCPYDEEFDGNDYCATHLLGLVGGEPAAVLRMRFFAGFAKIERLAVLARFRRTLIAKTVVESGIEICRRKGYTQLYGQAQKRLVKFWRRFGFRPLDKNFALVFSDHEYVEIGAELAPHSDPITPMSDPYLIIRPEGRWDEEGVLDRSASRAPTNPQTDRRDGTLSQLAAAMSDTVGDCDSTASPPSTSRPRPPRRRSESLR